MQGTEEATRVALEQGGTNASTLFIMFVGVSLLFGGIIVIVRMFKTQGESFAQRVDSMLSTTAQTQKENISLMNDARKEDLTTLSNAFERHGQRFDRAVDKFEETNTIQTRILDHVTGPHRAQVAATDPEKEPT